MLRVSILAIAAVALAACDDETETAGVEEEAEVAVVEEGGTVEPEPATEEAEIAEAEPEAEPEIAEAQPEAEPEIVEAETEEAEIAGAEPEAETEEAEIAEAQPQEAATTEDEGELAGEATELEAEEVTVLTDQHPAVETEVTNVDGQQETAAAEGDEQVAMAREGDLSEAMQSYQDWAVGRWAADASCDTDAVVLQENSLSLPGGVSCDEVQVSSAGADALSITGMSCEGADDDQVELEVNQAADGLSVSRGGQETELTRCP